MNMQMYDEARIGSATFDAGDFSKNTTESNARVFCKWLDKASSFDPSTGPTEDFLRKTGLRYSYTREVPNTSCIPSLNFVEASSQVHSSRAETRVAVVQNTLDGVYALEAAGRNRLAAQQMMNFVEDHLHTTSLDMANKLLTDADLHQLSSRSLIGLMRSTARARKELPAWPVAYKAACLAVKKLGKNPDALFIGLPKFMEM